MPIAFGDLSRPSASRALARARYEWSSRAIASSLDGNAGIILELSDGRDDVIPHEREIIWYSARRARCFSAAGPPIRPSASAEMRSNTPRFVGVQRRCECRDDLVVILDFSQCHHGVGAIAEFRGVFQLVQPLFLIFVKVSAS